MRIGRIIREVARPFQQIVGAVVGGGGGERRQREQQANYANQLREQQAYNQKILHEHEGRMREQERLVRAEQNRLAGELAQQQQRVQAGAARAGRAGRGNIFEEAGGAQANQGNFARHLGG